METIDSRLNVPTHRSSGLGVVVKLVPTQFTATAAVTPRQKNFSATATGALIQNMFLYIIFYLFII